MKYEELGDMKRSHKKFKIKVPKGLEHQKDFFDLGSKLTLAVAKKNSDYGSAFEQINKILGILYPNGIPVHQYPNVSILIRMLDKVCRLANENEKFYNEDAWMDLGGYSFVAMVSNLRNSKKRLNKRKR